ncbi:MAG TPA: response regulator [Methylomirabilota bacterium]|nr:response regulator [Methylomirabilota bacterium]
MQPSVLVVDDEADLAATCVRLLHRHGYNVVSAGTRRQALETLASGQYDLVVTDLRLPDGDGLDVVRAARALALPRPVVVITGFGSAQARQQALASGASAFLPKPFALTEFADLVDRLLPSNSRAARPRA